MWIDAQGGLYVGDCAAGDRAATAEELADHTLVRDRSAKRAAAGALFLAKLGTGVAHGGKTYQLDESSQQAIAALAARAGLAALAVPGVTWPGGFAFIAADNSQVAFTAAQYLAFATAAADTVIALRLAFRALKDRILAAEDAADLEAIDITTGWD